MTDSKTVSSDLRQHVRAPIELKVDYARLNSFFADYTKNISKGGTFIKTPKPLLEGTHFLFKLNVPGKAEPFELLGEVVRHVTDCEEAGMGIRFLYANEAQRLAFEDVVEHLMAQSLGSELAGRLLNKGPPP